MASSEPRGDDVALRRLAPDDAARAVPALAELLIDCVERGASVGFMPPMTLEKATRFWRSVADGVARGERALLVAEDASGVVGTVQLLLATPENQPHRADVAKMLVHGRARRRGIARRLMQAVEDAARDEGRTLLVLDTVTGSAADALYTGAGWRRVGEIPNYALMPDGAPCATTVFYKAIER
jgi:GNAT superfamily N-acetyltransferase